MANYLLQHGPGECRGGGVSGPDAPRESRDCLPGRVDVLIVGSGTVGASAAYHLARSGARVLVLDEAESPGAGSRVGAGICVPSVRLLDDPEMLAFARAGQRTLLKDLAEMDPAISAQPGLLRPVTSHAQADQLAASTSLAPDLLGSWLDRDKVAEIEPGLALRDIVGAFHDPSARILHAPGYVDALAERGTAAGAVLKRAQGRRPGVRSPRHDRPHDPWAGSRGDPGLGRRSMDPAARGSARPAGSSGARSRATAGDGRQPRPSQAHRLRSAIRRARRRTARPP